ncbi:MAG TPA: chitooligosaccharide deacetylase, partial [Syntrophomonas sp.]|nr:chitooligosaccharide deacetylase [Syntrophomonas sp.]
MQDELALRKSYLVVSNFNHEIITKGDTGKTKLVALTFDDGPDPQYTPKVLEILKKYQ